MGNSLVNIYIAVVVSNPPSVTVNLYPVPFAEYNIIPPSSVCTSRAFTEAVSSQLLQ